MLSRGSSLFFLHQTVLDALERKVEENDASSAQSPDRADVEGRLFQAFSLLANQLRPGVDGATLPIIGSPEEQQLDRDSHQFSTTDSSLQRSRKRRRLADPTRNASDSGILKTDLSASLPSQEVLDVVLSEYFATIHHWIPMVHQTRLRSRLEDEEESSRLVVLLHAMIAVTLPRISPERCGVTQGEKEELIVISGKLVMLHALDDLNVENLQALIMIAFDRIGSGNLSGAWSLVGTLTRTVDYLQLTVEPSIDRSRPLLEPLRCLDVPKDFAEAEERRRVFWNVFLLDRFCSVACGWNTGFTSDNVSRQLPCNGGVWARNEHAVAPFFGLWDKQAAKMGNSITFLPIHRASHSEQGQMPNVSPGGPPEPDMRSNLGAVAYRIEATESLSQISSFFLQQRVDFYNKEEVANWLTRFKELDLRLVHWKLFLPRKWKDSNVSNDEAQVRMDPNLTLAHITHNASMILLHQHIGYPATTLSQIVNLPSICSAETCQLAAVETAAIAQKYLKYTNDIMVPSEFAFCTFLAAQVLLVHCRHFGTDVAPEFFQLVQCLDGMSSRWRGKGGSGRSDLNNDATQPAVLDLAGRYAEHLRVLHTKSTEDVTFGTDILFQPGASLFMPLGSHLVSSPFAESSTRHEHDGASPHQANPAIPKIQPSSNIAQVNAQAGVLCHQDMHQRVPNTSYANNHYSVLPPSADATEISPTHPRYATQRRTSTEPAGNGIGGAGVTNFVDLYDPSMQYNALQPGLANISNAILGQQFADLDRVITFDGADFALDSMLGYEHVS
ncbi:hypothetical protein H2200_009294 [Cladophialophora chaetospira]|uniref:Xylanolytic transcriptional activator regulatory domain-containing protein n=1 Tax=Cladophialophora chaetospira TaxID=386627 RepID=A0AA38X3W7_9EURO|nr:hypothetical protein H2200_009294 [Cladophialophora chaetospira]